MTVNEWFRASKVKLSMGLSFLIMVAHGVLAVWDKKWINEFFALAWFGVLVLTFVIDWRYHLQKKEIFVMRCKRYNLDPAVATEADLERAVKAREAEVERALEVLSQSEKQP